MSDLLKSLKIEELFQNELKKDKNNKKKKANIFLNLQSKNKSNFAILCSTCTKSIKA